MKNLFGVIHNPNKYHGSGCDPYLSDLFEHPSVKEKFRLSVCDAHRAQCQGGPAYVAKWSWPFGGFLVAADPVALDTVGAGILEDRRRSLGLPSLEEAGRPPVHLKTAHRKRPRGRADESNRQDRNRKLETAAERNPFITASKEEEFPMDMAAIQKKRSRAK